MSDISLWIKQNTGKDIDEGSLPSEVVDIFNVLRDRYELMEKTRDDAIAKQFFYIEALNSVPTPIFVKDDELRFRFFNKSYKEFFGLMDGQYIGMGVRDLPYLSEEDRERYHKEDYDMLTQSSVIFYEADYPLDDGTHRESKYWSKGFLVPQTGEKGLVGEIVDISNEKRLQNELLGYVDKLQSESKDNKSNDDNNASTGMVFVDEVSNEIDVAIGKSILEGKQFSAVVISIDNAKDLKNKYGQSGVDGIWRQLTGVVFNETDRTKDIAAWDDGGGMYAFLPGNDLFSALEIAGSIIENVKRRVKLPDGEPVSVSIGVCELKSDENLNALIERLNTTLQRAEDEGGNRIIIDHD